MRKTILALALLLATAAPAFAGLNVVATLPWIGSLAKTLGGDRVAVTTLVKPNQDPHYLEAKPSMILAARKADMILYNGLDLEIGYLPIILESARNPKIVPGKPGNLDCSRFVQVIEKPTAVDRSMGDIHPLGNPHYNFSPANVLRVAEGMAGALADLDRANADYYRANYSSFAARFNEKLQQWQRVDLKGKEFVAYHRYFEYLAAEFGFRIVGYVEPKPGIPPTAGHIENLIAEMKSGKPDGILVTPGYGLKESESLSARTGTRVIVLPQDVGAMPGTDDWFAFMDTILAALR
jgi:zinc/manganese transport system substrate-binding protein